MFPNRGLAVVFVRCYVNVSKKATPRDLDRADLPCRPEIVVRAPQAAQRSSTSKIFSGELKILPKEAGKAVYCRDGAYLTTRLFKAGYPLLNSSQRLYAGDWGRRYCAVDLKKRCER